MNTAELKNWKPNFHSLHPYAFLWIRLIMSLTLNCHLIFRLFKIENKLPTFTCIELLKEALNKSGSFQHSLFQFAERLHLTIAIHPEHHSLSSRKYLYTQEKCTQDLLKHICHSGI